MWCHNSLISRGKQVCEYKAGAHSKIKARPLWSSMSKRTSHLKKIDHYSHSKEHSER